MKTWQGIAVCALALALLVSLGVIDGLVRERFRPDEYVHSPAGDYRDGSRSAWPLRYAGFVTPPLPGSTEGPCMLAPPPGLAAGVEPRARMGVDFASGNVVTQRGGPQIAAFGPHVVPRYAYFGRGAPVAPRALLFALVLAGGSMIVFSTLAVLMHLSRRSDRTP
jgi:hypothetical protein